MIHLLILCFCELLLRSEHDYALVGTFPVYLNFWIKYKNQKVHFLLMQRRFVSCLNRIWAVDSVPHLYFLAFENLLLLQFRIFLLSFFWFVNLSFFFFLAGFVALSICSILIFASYNMQRRVTWEFVVNKNIEYLWIILIFIIYPLSNVYLRRGICLWFSFLSVLLVNLKHLQLCGPCMCISRSILWTLCSLGCLLLLWVWLLG